MSNESKHTPGPWAVNGKSYVTTSGDYRSVGKRTNVIADCRLANGENDARLIAAAPELLEALEAAYCIMMDCVPDSADADKARARSMARAAIAKAKGEAE